jgi:hypothetical protein
LDSKQQKLEKLRQQKAAKELDGFTGKPETNKTKHVDSKLGIDLRTSEYIEQLKEKENVKKQYQDFVHKRRELRDTIECTHKPQITPVPSYLKDSGKKSKIGYSQPPKQKPSSYQTLHNKNKQEPLRLSYNSHRQEDVPSLFDDTESGQGQSEQDININEMYFSPSQHQLTTQSPEATKRKQFTPQLPENKENLMQNVTQNPTEFGNFVSMDSESEPKITTMRFVENEEDIETECRIKPLTLRSDQLSSGRNCYSPSFRCGDKGMFSVMSSRDDRKESVQTDLMSNVL